MWMRHNPVAPLFTRIADIVMFLEEHLLLTPQDLCPGKEPTWRLRGQFWYFCRDSLSVRKYQVDQKEKSLFYSIRQEKCR